MLYEKKLFKTIAYYYATTAFAVCQFVDLSVIYLVFRKK